MFDLKRSFHAEVHRREVPFKRELLECAFQNLNHLDFAVLSCQSPRKTTTVASHLTQEHFSLTFLSTWPLMCSTSMTFFLDIWQLIEAICASHFLRWVHCVGPWPKSFVFSACVNVNFERLLGISGSLDLDFIGYGFGSRRRKSPLCVPVLVGFLVNFVTSSE